MEDALHSRDLRIATLKKEPLFTKIVELEAILTCYQNEYQRLQTYFYCLLWRVASLVRFLVFSWMLLSYNVGVVVVSINSLIDLPNQVRASACQFKCPIKSSQIAPGLFSTE